MAGRPGLPGNTMEATAAATVAANGALWTLGLKDFRLKQHFHCVRTSVLWPTRVRDDPIPLTKKAQLLLLF